MSDDIITGHITDTETGITSEVNHYLFSGGFNISTFVLVKKVEHYKHKDDSFQVSVDCYALDSFGFVFELTIEFMPDTQEEMDKLLDLIQTNSTHYIKGQYGLSMQDKSLTVYGPHLKSLPPDFTEDEIRRIFEHNMRIPD